MDIAIGIVIGIVAGLAAALLSDRVLGIGARRAALRAADATLAAARQQADHHLKEAEIKAKEESLRLREEFDRGTRERRQELTGVERALKDREHNLDLKVDKLQRQLDELARRDERLTAAEKDLRAQQERAALLLQEHQARLETIAAMTRDDARAQLLKQVEDTLAAERGMLVRRHLDDTRRATDREAQKLLIQSMQRYAGECAYERTTCTVPLPSDEMKGRIIGREGRNIRVFENITGVNVLIDDTPSAVVISCFDVVRREVARLSLERLVADGRIHPSRVEEVVAKARADVEQEMARAGEDALARLQLVGVAPQLVEMLGRLKFRHSFSQNVLTHSVEVANFMALMAMELKLDVKTAKRIGIFHDIGKALDHEVEGSHALIGMEFLKRCGEAADVLNAVGCHHDELPPETPLAALVTVADTLSASRPGARSETTEMYIKRLEQLEKIGASFTGVESCFAVQAGREIRVVVEPQRIGELEACDLSRNIAERIMAEMQYPGQIKVCVIRETRAIEYAK